jgi:hypothetical protein
MKAMKATAVGLALIVLPFQAQSASAQESRWSQWSGCWELVTEGVRDSAFWNEADKPNAFRDPATGEQSSARRPRICVTPMPDGGARFETTVSGQPPVEYSINPDGADHALSEAACRGTQRARWSEDGLRFFAHADLTCTGDSLARKVSGMALIARNGQWLDVQAVTVQGRESVRVRRYRRADEDASNLFTRAGSSLSLDDVKDASRHVSSLALEAALVETNAGYDLDARRVADLDAAGVPDNVIDLIVALSYPEKFVVDRTARATPPTPLVDPFSLGWAFGHSYWYDDFFYSPYSYAYSRFGPFGSPYYDGGLIVVLPNNEPQPSGTGRVVDGRGYTQVRTRQEAAQSASRSGGVMSAGGSAASSGPSSSSGSSSSGSSGGSVAASGGYTSGGSGGDAGRTAQPR